MSDEKVTRIERVRVLQGHVDADSAYVVEDYPYGGGLRCTIRYWVETATKGRAKGKQRYVSQTTNPRRPDRRWNKPHPETYAEMVVLYLDGEDHVKWWSTGLWMSAADDARTRMMGIYDQFTDDQRRMYDALRKYAQRNRSSWGEFEEAVTALAAEIRHTGREPRFTAQGWTVWDTPDGRRLSLGDPPDVEVHLAAAREKLANDG